MTAEQLELAKELDKEIKRVKGMVVDLQDVVRDLKAYEQDEGHKSTPIRIEVDYGYRQTPPINLMSIISFLEEQKSKYEEEVNELNEEFSKL